MDHQTIGHGGLVLTVLEGGRGRPPDVRDRVQLDPLEWCFLVVDSGIAKRSADVLTGLRQALARDSGALDGYIAEAAHLSEALHRAMRAAEVAETHHLVNAAHDALASLPGVVSPELGEFRSGLLRAGLPSAKLSGSGPGGAVFTVLPRADAEPYVKRIRRRLPGVQAFVARPENNGVELINDVPH